MTAKAETIAEQNGHKGKAPKDKVHWLAKIQSDADFERHLNRWKPSPARLIVDTYNGRYWLVYPGQHRKSISWTARGLEQASLMWQKQAWDWHTLATGQQCPVPLGFFGDLIA